MTYLTLIFLVKIIGTIALVVVPSLLFPREKLDKEFGLKSENSLMYKLYGIAVLSLLIGYSYGAVSAESGVFPGGIVLMGLVSNAGAAIALLTMSRTKTLRLSSVFFGIIAILLASSLLMKDAFLGSLGI